MLVGAILGLLMAEKVEADGLPEFYIKAVNPGYMVDGVQNVGEMIEIGRKNSDKMESLAGLTIGYTNSSGNNTVLVDLSKYLWTAGETIQLHLASSPGSELAQVVYSKTLAFKAGPLTLMWNGEVIDSVCWTGKDGCYNVFSSSKPTTLLRNIQTGVFEHATDYKPGGDGVLEEVESGDVGDPGDAVVSKCKGVMFSEILSYYESSQSE